MPPLEQLLQSFPRRLKALFARPAQGAAGAPGAAGAAEPQPGTPEAIHLAELRAAIAQRKQVKIIIGSSGTSMPDWLSTEYPYVNVADAANLSRLFKRGQLTAILAEHVWEHLTDEQARTAARNCFDLLAPGGYARIAVPDGLHSDPDYIEYVRPGGYGAGSDDHKVLYTLDTLTAVFVSAGFEVKPLEWFDANRVFHANDWNPDDGYICRSTRFDERNHTNPTAYTSLIIDAIKPAAGAGGRG